MSDLIDRQAAIDVLRTCYDTETISMDNGDEYINYCDAVGGIEQLPSAQSERKNGKWIFKKSMMYCSECCDGFEVGNYHYFKFCPNCGCRMKGEQE